MAEGHLYSDKFVGDNSWNGNEHNVLLYNKGKGDFVEMAEGLGVGHAGDGRAAVFADFDNDGDSDIALSAYREKAALYINHLGNKKNWVKVSLKGTSSNRDGIGSTVTVFFGKRQLAQALTAGSGFSGQNSKTKLFGIDGEAEVHRVEVLWPSGIKETFGAIKAKDHATLVEGEGQKVVAKRSEEATQNPAKEEGKFPMWTLALLLGGLCFGVTLAWRLRSAKE